MMISMFSRSIKLNEWRHKLDKICEEKGADYKFEESQGTQRQ